MNNNKETIYVWEMMNKVKYEVQVSRSISNELKKKKVLG